MLKAKKEQAGKQTLESGEKHTTGVPGAEKVKHGAINPRRW